MKDCIKAISAKIDFTEKTGSFQSVCGQSADKLWTSIAVDQKEFDSLLKDLLGHIFDYTALETHPLTLVVFPPDDYPKSRGEYIQEFVHRAIQGFKPKTIPYSPAAIEWRPYIILHERYVRGTSFAEIANLLYLSERQVRRDQRRATQALGSRLWRIIRETSKEPTSRANLEPTTEHDRAYRVRLQPLDLNTLVEGVLVVMEKRLVEEEIVLQVALQESSPLALADRVIVRQILISIINYALHLQSDDPVLEITTLDRGPWATVCVLVEVGEQWSYWAKNEQGNLIRSIDYWRQQMQAEFIQNYPLDDQPGRVRLELKLPRADRAVLLVVDDQEPTQRLFQRYLAHQELKVIGISNPEQVLPVARQIRPALITLDVMMPNVDGWEILQALQTDDQTRHIPVLICSAWAEPELARSLGAAGFIKKPVTQKDLLQTLADLGLVT